jgi:hypothetical protein
MLMTGSNRRDGMEHSRSSDSGCRKLFSSHDHHLHGGVHETLLIIHLSSLSAPTWLCDNRYIELAGGKRRSIPPFITQFLPAMLSNLRPHSDCYRSHSAANMIRLFTSFSGEKWKIAFLQLFLARWRLLCSLQPPFVLATM